MTEQLTETAYHEAGHVVVAYVLGLGIGSASIVEDEETDGRTITPADEEAFTIEDHDLMERRLVMCCAGAEAEGMLTGNDTSLRGSEASDAGYYSVWLSDSEEGSRIVMERAGNRARSILSNNWTVLRVLAEDLLDHGELGREQILAILKARLR